MASQSAEADHVPRRSLFASRRRQVLAFGVAVLVVVASGFVAASRITSPADRAARTQPPPPSVLTAAVTRQSVRQTIVTRGTVVSAFTANVTPVATSGPPVVTRLPKQVRDEVRAGEVVAEVSGRPVIALPGSIPVYRDLVPGSSGPDVAQLQAALKQLGYPVPDASGIYGSGTKNAVAKLYRDRGYDAPTAGGPESSGAHEAGSDAVTAASRALQQLLSDPTASPTAVTYARQDLVTAQQRLRDLEQRSGPEVAAAEVVFVPEFPAQVSQQPATLGPVPTGPVVTLTAGALRVSAKLRVADGRLLSAGRPVTVDADLVGSTFEGSVSAIGTVQTGEAAPGAAGGGAGGAPFLPVTITTNPPLDAILLGQDVRLTLVTAQTEGDVLTVPESALSTSATGEAYVTVLTGTANRSRVTVRPGLSGQGFVEVAPLAGTLEPDQRVVVGG